MPIVQHLRGYSKGLSLSQIEMNSESQASLSYIVRKTDDRQTDLMRLSSAGSTDWMGAIFSFLIF